MKSLYILILFSMAFTSCKAQDKTNPTIPESKDNNSPTTLKQKQGDDQYYIPISGKIHNFLPHTIIRNMVEDKSGNIWFATFSGIFRYDGKSFTNLSEEIGVEYSRIFSLLEDKSGNLWFGTILRGVCRYDGKTSKIFTTKDGLADNDVYCILEDKTGKLWFGTSYGLSCYDGKSFTNYTTKEGLIDNSIYSMVQDKTGKIWIGTEGGVCIFDGKGFTKFPNKEGAQFRNVRAMIQDKSGNMWFGGPDGACRYDGKSYTTYKKQTEFISLNNLVLKETILFDFIGSMMEDKSGNIWFGHPHPIMGGVSRYEGKFFTHFTATEGLCNNDIYCMMQDKKGDIWFCSLTMGACRFDGKMFKEVKL